MSDRHAIWTIEISRKLRPFQIPHEAGRDPIQPDSLKPGLAIADLCADLLSIVVDRNDAEIIDRYRERTIVIDTDPIGTTDFRLSDIEKEFLVLQGRSAALKFLAERRLLGQEQSAVVHQVASEAERARANVMVVRRRRRRVRLAKAAIAIASIVAAMAMIFGYIPKFSGVVRDKDGRVSGVKVRVLWGDEERADVTGRLGRFSFWTWNWKPERPLVEICKTEYYCRPICPMLNARNLDWSNVEIHKKSHDDFPMHAESESSACDTFTRARTGASLRNAMSNGVILDLVTTKSDRIYVLGLSRSSTLPREFAGLDNDMLKKGPLFASYAYVVAIGRGGPIQCASIGPAYFQEQHGALDIKDDRIEAFVIHKSIKQIDRKPYSSFRMYGVTFGFSSSFASVGMEEQFADVNWGWHPYYDKGGTLWFYDYEDDAILKRNESGTREIVFDRCAAADGSKPMRKARAIILSRHSDGLLPVSKDDDAFNTEAASGNLLNRIRERRFFLVEKP